MKHPRFWRNVWLVAALLGVAAATTAFLMPDGGQGFTLQAVLGVGGLTVAPIATVLALQSTAELRRFERLDRGLDVIARWHVDPASWSVFAERNRALQDAQAGQWRPNFVTVPDTTEEPMEIVVSRDALRIGGEYHALSGEALEGAQWLPGRPGILEFYCVQATGRTSTRYVLRFPAALGGDLMAHGVLRHFTTPVKLGPIAHALSAPARAAERNPRSARNIALGVALVGGLIGAALIAQADTPWVREAMRDDSSAVLVMIGAVGGPIIALAALLLAAAWHRRIPAGN